MICAAIVVVNLSLTWTKFDQETLNRATNRCSYYYKTSPCLKKFTKLKELHYQAICAKQLK